MRKFKVVSLFTGAGGLDLGFVRAGFDIVFASELESSACETYRLNFGKLHDISYLKEGDVNHFWDEIPKHPDILIGGPPCQSYSTAGPRTALQSENGRLFLKTIQNLQKIQPRFFILENVQGILTFKDEKDPNKPDQPDNPLPILLNAIKEVGYEVEYRLFDLSEFGIPQRRKRVIFFGKKIGDPTVLKRLFPKKIFAQAQTVDELFKSIPGNLTGSESITPNVTQKIFGPILAPGENLETLKKLSEVELHKRLAEKGLMNDPKIPRENGKIRIPQRGQDVQRLNPAKIAPTMSFNGGTNVHWHPWLDRAISVREAATIQTFPYDFEFLGKNMEEKYHQIANAVPPMFAEVLARSLLTILTEGK